MPEVFLVWEIYIDFLAPAATEIRLVVIFADEKAAIDLMELRVKNHRQNVPKPPPTYRINYKVQGWKLGEPDPDKNSRDIKVEHVWPMP